MLQCINSICFLGVGLTFTLYISVFPKNLKFSPISKEIEKKKALLTQFHEKRVHLALFLATINVHAITRYILINLKFHLITFQGCVYYTGTQISETCGKKIGYSIENTFYST